MIRSLPTGLRALIAASAALALNMGVYGARSCPHHTGVPADDQHVHEMATVVGHAEGAHAHDPAHSDEGSSGSGDHGEHEECTCVGSCLVVGTPTPSSTEDLRALANPNARAQAAVGAHPVDLPPRLDPFQLPLATAPPRS